MTWWQTRLLFPFFFFKKTLFLEKARGDTKKKLAEAIEKKKIYWREGKQRKPVREELIS